MTARDYSRRIERDAATWRNTTIAELAFKKARETPDRVAIYLEREPDATYAAIAQEAKCLATGLRGLGLAAGDVISFQFPNWREGAALDIAAAALGLVVNPIVPIYRDAELRFILKDAQTRLIFIPDQYRNVDYVSMVTGLRSELPHLDHIVTLRAEGDIEGVLRYETLVQNDPIDESSLPKVDPNSVKCRLYTSGTTGFPKAVLHSHNTLIRISDNTIEHSGIDSSDVMIMPSPITHITGYASGLSFPFVSEGSSALMERWDANAAVDYINRVKGTMTVGATPFLVELLDAAEARGDGLPSLRQFSCGGAAVPPQVILRAYKVFDNCIAVRVYGSTEAPIITLGWREDPQLAATTDGQVWGYEVKILDDSGKEVGVGVDGEIAAQGPGMFLGYADEQQNSEAHTVDGFFLTGDIGHLTPEGAILITDRKKDIIIRGGENLSAKEIEDALHEHPDIREVAIVAMPHERLGEGVCAYIIPASDQHNLSQAEIARFTESLGLARQKIPERVILVDDLPRTPSGKVKKNTLRDELSAAAK
ncbi:MAG: acyl-CoA synthetase [Halioglobus sp.]|jgi:acyl-CoA synthetase (AMP-forming)/AMP-acid ligase II